MKNNKNISVCAAVLRKENKLLLCSRPLGKDHSGFWEFPGGKKKHMEKDYCCLRRELIEELGVKVKVLDQIFSVNHDYPGKSVNIRFYRCLLHDSRAEVMPQEGQKSKWIDLKELAGIKLLPADIPLADFLVLK